MKPSFFTRVTSPMESNAVIYSMEEEIESGNEGLSKRTIKWMKNNKIHVTSKRSYDFSNLKTMSQQMSSPCNDLTRRINGAIWDDHSILAVISQSNPTKLSLELSDSSKKEKLELDLNSMPPKLQELTVSIGTATDLKEITFIGLSDLQSLKKLRLHFNWCRRLERVNVNSITKARMLRELELMFVGLDCMSQRSFDALLDSLSRLQSLAKLSITFKKNLT
eukprot:TRINITY_DN20028_c0_g1_i2.p1 TRINITY_DN20028_c0_g1~~TRINITY_DN20028_c0_g1_i2.p1  ORF type:complete len:221 (-),score=34.87 TRINITY_DN20028_c0_g1_i2:855-1517(-)